MGPSFKLALYMGPEDEACVSRISKQVRITDLPNRRLPASPSLSWLGETQL